MSGRGPAWWLAGLGALLGFLVLRAWNPEHSGFQVCLFRTLLDLPCPGCGLTRAMAHLARGSLRGAFALHPLAPLLAAEAGIVWIAWGVLGARPLASFFSSRAEMLVLLHAAPLFGLWLGRAATGTLPF